MTTATSTRPSPRTPWSAHAQPRSYPRPTTTPLGVPTRTPSSVGQVPPLPSKARSQTQDPRTPSPSYFGLVVEAGNNPQDSNVGGHVKNNWSSPSSSIRSTAVTSPKVVPLDANPDFEAFRKQSESNPFLLGHGHLSHFSQGGGTGRLPTLGSLANDRTNTEEEHRSNNTQTEQIVRDFSDGHSDRGESSAPSRNAAQNSNSNDAPFFDQPRMESPLNVPSLPRSNPRRTHNPHLDDRLPRLSLPGNRLNPPSPTASHASLARAETLPSSLNPGTPSMIAPRDLVEFFKTQNLDNVLLLDLRVSPQFVQSRIKGAMNLCIPTTLLKRPSFNVHKLSETFTKADEKAKFSHWKEASHILVYDANSLQLKDAISSSNILKKFVAEGWEGTPFILRGGFLDFARRFPEWVVMGRDNDANSSNQNPLSLNSSATGVTPVAGGCPMPATKSVANPFFGNIRQNMDLIGGVGQMAVKYPALLTDKNIGELPAWIREAVDEKDQGKVVADKFLQIEKDEQARMQKALTGHVSYGSPTINSPRSVQIAGIEQGTKNRYKDMLPYDHSRVRLQNVSSGDSDYVNASHVKAAWSNRHYIASQAPVPATFEDFWRVVWEQDARVIVMLTAESEGGQRKSHPYWLPDNYGPLKLKALSEKRVSLESSPSSVLSPKGRLSPGERPGISRRRATNPHDNASRDDSQDAGSPISPEVPHVIIRKLTLAHDAYPFSPLREITQLQYSSWPDFGAPAHPAHVLALVEHCGAVVRSYAGSQGTDARSPAQKGERPIVVHCSAGCGRTGTFCTVDSVVDMLKRQKVEARKEASTHADGNGMDIDGEEWVAKNDVDLIAKTVEDLRLQRLSMVQTLRQFVLCYETVLEWLVKDMVEKSARDGLRKSYQG